MIVKTVPIYDIVVADRAREDYQGIPELAEDILKNGLITAIAVVDEVKPGSGYRLLAGGRRVRAIQLLEESGRSSKLFDPHKIPIRVYSQEDSGTILMKRIELHENIMRQDLNHIEKAKLVKAIHDLEVSIHGPKKSTSPNASGHSIRDTAKILEKSHTQVRRSLRIAEAVESIPEIADCKNEAEAIKFLDQLEEKLILEELSRRAEEEKPKTDVDKRKKELIDSYVLQDFFDGVKEIPDETIDLVELDPDYGIGIVSEKKKLKSDIDRSQSDYKELSSDPKIFLKQMELVLTHCYRVMKPNAWLVLWFAHGQYYDSLFEVARRVGFVGNKLPAIWVKNIGQTKQQDFNLGQAYEMFFYLRKGSPAIMKHRLNTYVYDVVPSGKKCHPTERPISMMRDILATFAMPGARVFVPFLGSGNTILAGASAELNMKVFGFDLGKEFRDKFIYYVTNEFEL